MSLLTDLYGITVAVTGSSDFGAILGTPVTHYFSFDLANVNDSKNKRVSILWNFGDPFSSENEIVSGSLLDSPSHTFTRNGWYNIYCIATIEGTTLQLMNRYLVGVDPTI